jgi:DNA-directed RNA polymerase subunit H (RpoH/RPB5)
MYFGSILVPLAGGVRIGDYRPTAQTCAMQVSTANKVPHIRILKRAEARRSIVLKVLELRSASFPAITPSGVRWRRTRCEQALRRAHLEATTVWEMDCREFVLLECMGTRQD